MICIKCKNETPDTDMYCAHCGVKMDVTYDQMKRKLKKDIKQEKEEETEAFCRWLLVIATTSFITAMVFRSMWINPPAPNPVPGYIPSIEIEHETEDPTKPIIIRKPKK